MRVIHGEIQAWEHPLQKAYTVVLVYDLSLTLWYLQEYIRDAPYFSWYRLNQIQYNLYTRY